MMQAAKDVYDARPIDASSITISTRQPDAFKTRASLATKHKKPAETVGVNIAPYEPAEKKKKRGRPAAATKIDREEEEEEPAAKKVRTAQQQHQHTLCERCKHTIEQRPTAADAAARMLQQRVSDAEDDDDDGYQQEEEEEEEPWMADVKEQILEKEPSMAGSRLLAKLGRRRKQGAAKSGGGSSSSRDAG
jgi:hypothetical protein